MAVYFGEILVVCVVVFWIVSLWKPDNRSISSFLQAFVWPIFWFRFKLGGKRPAIQDLELSRKSRSRRMASRADSIDSIAKRFRTIREAKDYLAGRIAAEADREGEPLSEVEKKMLYFSQTGWTLPNILEVNAEFERDYVEDDYERKIARLADKIRARDAAENPQEQDAWGHASLRLSGGDHYLSVLIDREPVRKRMPVWLRVPVTLLALLVLALLYEWSKRWFRDH
jgi:hypothetical protein